MKLQNSLKITNSQSEVAESVRKVTLRKDCVVADGNLPVQGRAVIIASKHWHGRHRPRWVQSAPIGTRTRQSSTCGGTITTIAISRCVLIENSRCTSTTASPTLQCCWWPRFWLLDVGLWLVNVKFITSWAESMMTCTCDGAGFLWMWNLLNRIWLSCRQILVDVFTIVIIHSIIIIIIFCIIIIFFIVIILIMIIFWNSISVISVTVAVFLWVTITIVFIICLNRVDLRLRSVAICLRAASFETNNGKLFWGWKNNLKMMPDWMDSKR